MVRTGQSRFSTVQMVLMAAFLAMLVALVYANWGRITNLIAEGLF